MAYEIQLGDLVRDPITGVQGVAVCRAQWLYGCLRITVQPEGFKDGKAPDTIGFEEPQLEVIERGKHAPKQREASAPTGGPRPEPMRQSDVSR